MKEYYTGKYEMVTRAEIDADPKYQDKNVYRYILHDNVSATHKTTYTRNTSTGIDKVGTEDTYALSYFLYDRTADTETDLEVTAGVPAKAMKKTAQKLNSYLAAK